MKIVNNEQSLLQLSCFLFSLLNYFLHRLPCDQRNRKSKFHLQVWNSPSFCSIKRNQRINCFYCPFFYILMNRCKLRCSVSGIINIIISCNPNLFRNFIFLSARKLIASIANKSERKNAAVFFANGI